MRSLPKDERLSPSRLPGNSAYSDRTSNSQSNDRGIVEKAFMVGRVGVQNARLPASGVQKFALFCTVSALGPASFARSKAQGSTLWTELNDLVDRAARQDQRNLSVDTKFSVSV